MSEYSAVSKESTSIDRELLALEAELKRLEAEYNMFFAGRLPRPPWETRTRVTAMVNRLDRMHISNYGDRFRFSTLQTRYSSFIDLWDRGLRAKEEGRPGPFAFARPVETEKKPKKIKERVLHTVTFSDPLQEIDKLRNLYDTLADARREAGQESLPFHKFAELIRTQVAQLKKKGSAEVAFRVAVKDGKVVFTAKVVKGKSDH